jgi:hypothetical protein
VRLRGRDSNPNFLIQRREGAVRPQREGALTAQGYPRARFQRAIEGRWVFHAELAEREEGI